MFHTDANTAQLHQSLCVNFVWRHHEGLLVFIQGTKDRDKEWFYPSVARGTTEFNWGYLQEPRQVMGSHCKGNIHLLATIKLPHSLYLQNCPPSIIISFWKNCDLEGFTAFIFTWKTISSTSSLMNLREQWYLKALTHLQFPFSLHHEISLMLLKEPVTPAVFSTLFIFVWFLTTMSTFMILRQTGINERLTISCTFIGHLPSMN